MCVCVDSVFLVEVAPNTAVNPTKLVMAITRCDKKSRINYTGLSLTEFAEAIGETLRIGMSKFRQMHQTIGLKTACLKNRKVG